jgi:hypothetical protein
LESIDLDAHQAAPGGAQHTSLAEFLAQTFQTAAKLLRLFEDGSQIA